MRLLRWQIAVELPPWERRWLVAMLIVAVLGVALGVWFRRAAGGGEAMFDPPPVWRSLDGSR
jgi:hypothetical protein